MKTSRKRDENVLLGVIIIAICLLVVACIILIVLVSRTYRDSKDSAIQETTFQSKYDEGPDGYSKIMTKEIDDTTYTFETDVLFKFEEKSAICENSYSFEEQDDGRVIVSKGDMSAQFRLVNGNGVIADLYKAKKAGVSSTSPYEYPEYVWTEHSDTVHYIHYFIDLSDYTKNEYSYGVEMVATIKTNEGSNHGDDIFNEVKDSILSKLRFDVAEVVKK